MISTYWVIIAVVMAAASVNGEITDPPIRSVANREISSCQRVGHTRRVTIPDCVAFMITTNACRGFCESWSVPSTSESLEKNPGKAITSVGQCCNIMASEDVTVRVMCVGGPRDFTFKSAKTCSCFHCKKD